MEIIPSIKEAVKDAVHKELEGATINDIPILEFLEKANNAVENNNCNLNTLKMAKKTDI